MRSEETFFVGVLSPAVIWAPLWTPVGTPLEDTSDEKDGWTPFWTPMRTPLLDTSVRKQGDPVVQITPEVNLIQIPPTNH